jgi:Rhodopirellula transposase DDE domain
MRVAEGYEESLAAEFTVLFPHLDERQRRLLLGAEARALGHGGIRLVARAARVREATVALGAAELDSGQEPLGRARRPGGGRKRVADLDPGLRPALLALVEPGTRGDPMSALRWTTKSTRKLAAELTRQGHRISADTVADVLRQEGFSLQGNAKTIEGRQHPDRDAQFRYINDQVAGRLAAGQPVISVDTKKKEEEKVGNFANSGAEREPAGQPVRVRDHDFPDEELGKAVPYGIYDVAANAGWVNVGTDGDTAAFAVESIRRWWQAAGKPGYPGATALLITAGAGGSNGARLRLWKTELAAFAGQAGPQITVAHFPPGTSKWNRIEHRLFSAISMNWRGRPLTSHEVIVQTIAATTTRTGLTVQAELDTGLYPTGIKISDQQMAALPITRHIFHGDWNYTLDPHPAQTRGPAEPGPQAPTGWDRATLTRPALTGLPRKDLDALVTALAAPWNAQREQDRHQRRGSDRQRAPGAGPPPRLTLADRVLATLLHLHLSMPCPLPALLLGVNRTTISRAIGDTLPLLDQHASVIPEPATARIRTLADLHAYATAKAATPAQEIKPAC